MIRSLGDAKGCQRWSRRTTGTENRMMLDELTERLAGLGVVKAQSRGRHLFYDTCIRRLTPKHFMSLGLFHCRCRYCCATTEVVVLNNSDCLTRRKKKTGGQQAMAEVQLRTHSGGDLCPWRASNMHTQPYAPLPSLAKRYSYYRGGG
jgi:hypothetical protein